MKYDFAKVIDRTGTSSLKWDIIEEETGSKDVIPMWVADMDFESPEEVKQAIIRRAEQGIYGYTVRMDSFSEALSAYYKRNHNWQIDTQWIVRSECGLVNGIKNIIEVLTDPGDEIIVQGPVYHAFYRPIRQLNRVVTSNSLKLENGRYVMDFDHLRSVITDRTKLMILCNPHNPVGRAWTRQELEALCAVLNEYNIQLVSDEIHMDLVYEPHIHIPVMTLDNDVARNAIVCVSATKTFNIAGFYMGSLIIQNQILREKVEYNIAKNEDNITNVFGVVACEAAYRYGDEWKKQLMSYLKHNVDFVRDYLQKKIPLLRLIEPEATYLLWIDCRSLKISQEQLEHLFLQEIKIWPSMGGEFGQEGEGFIRINIACPRVTLEECMKRIEKKLIPV